MARGKAAAQSANRRTAEALARIDALEQQRRSEQESWATERESLRTELRLLRNDMDQQVNSKAAARIAAAEAEAGRRVDDVTKAYRERGRKAIQLLFSSEVPIKAELGQEIAALLEVRIADTNAINRVEKRNNRYRQPTVLEAWRQRAPQNGDTSTYFNGRPEDA